jgi:hypothetical protein
MGSGNKSSTPRPRGNQESEASILERMNEALKRMMSTPHETQKEMVERRRKGQAKANPKS